MAFTEAQLRELYQELQGRIPPSVLRRLIESATGEKVASEFAESLRALERVLSAGREKPTAPETEGQPRLVFLLACEPYERHALISSVHDASLLGASWFQRSQLYPSLSSAYSVARALIGSSIDPALGAALGVQLRALRPDLYTTSAITASPVSDQKPTSLSPSTVRTEADEESAEAERIEGVYWEMTSNLLDECMTMIARCKTGLATLQSEMRVGVQ